MALWKKRLIGDDTINTNFSINCFLISKLLRGPNSDVINCHHFTGAVVPGMNFSFYYGWNLRYKWVDTVLPAYYFRKK